MKLTAFILSYCAPTAVAFVLFVFFDRGFSLGSFGLLVPALTLALMASTGLDFFGLRKRSSRPTKSELALRGAIAGVVFLVATLTALSLAGLESTFYFATALSLTLAPVALLIPLKRPAKTKKDGIDSTPRTET